MCGGAERAPWTSSPPPCLSSLPALLQRFFAAAEHVAVRLAPEVCGRKGSVGWERREVGLRFS